MKTLAVALVAAALLAAAVAYAHGPVLPPDPWEDGHAATTR